MKVRHHRRRNLNKRRFLSQWDMADIKRHEATMNAHRRRMGLTDRPMTCIVWSCGCCQGYSILEHRRIANTTVQEEAAKRKAEEQARLEYQEALKNRGNLPHLFSGRRPFSAA